MKLRERIQRVLDYPFYEELRELEKMGKTLDDMQRMLDDIKIYAWGVSPD